MPTAALDIGGSGVKSCIVEAGDPMRPIAGRHKDVPLGRSIADLRDCVLRAVERILATQDGVKRVGICTTGSVDVSGRVLRGGFYDGYEDVSWEEVIGDRLSGKVDRVTVMNDGAAAAWGEFCVRDNPAIRHSVHLVVGTGVGGGAVVDGRLLRGATGTAGALGHVKVETTSQVQCVCGAWGCVEVLAAGPAIVRKFDELAGSSSDAHFSTDWQRPFECIVDLAKNGDHGAQSSFIAAGRSLGDALSSIVNVLAPELVTIGGGVVDASPVQEGENVMVAYARLVCLQRCLRGIGQRLEIRRATLGNDSGLIGAALIAENG